MRYSRVLIVTALLAAIGAGAVALGRSPAPPRSDQLRRTVQLSRSDQLGRSDRLSRSDQLRRTLQQEVQSLFGQHVWIVQPPRRGAHAPSINVPAPQLGASTCFVGGGSCSITPCVVPVATAGATVSALPNTAANCPSGSGVPRAIPATATALTATTFHPQSSYSSTQWPSRSRSPAAPRRSTSSTSTG